MTSTAPTTKEFLQVIHGEDPTFQGFTEIRSFSAEGTPRQDFFRDTELASTSALLTGGNVYFGVMLRRERRGDKEHVVFRATCAWADVDYGSAGHKKTSPFSSREEALGHIRAFREAPSIIVDSGHGFHCYWLLHEPRELQDLAQIERINRGLGHALKGDAAWDASRVLRVPGTMNTKPGTEPVLCKVEAWHPDRRHDWDDLEAWAMEADAEKLQPVTFTGPAEAVDLGTLSLPDRIKTLIRDGKEPGGKYPSRSEADMAVVHHLVAAGATDDLIRSIFADLANGIGDRYRDKGAQRDYYLGLTIAKARTPAKQEIVPTPAPLPTPLRQTPVGRYNDSLVPEVGFIRSFLDYADPLTDAPTEFLYASALAGAAALLGNRCWLQHGTQRIYPNLWVLILAESGTLRKSTCISAVRYFLDKNEGTLLPDQITPETFLEGLQTTPAGLFALYEFGSFLRNMERSYMAGFMGDLTQLYDCPPSFKRKRKNKKGEAVEIVVKNPALSILSASTLDWYVDAASEEDLRGGFLARFLYVYVAHRTKPRMAFPPAPDGVKQTRALLDAGKLMRIDGEFTLSTEARTLYLNWYQANGLRLEASPIRGKVEAFVPRLETAALKFALIVEALTSERREISGASMALAIRIADYFTSQVEALRAGPMEFNRFERFRSGILKMLADAPDGIDHSTLLRTGPVRTADYFKSIIGTMEEQGVVEQFKKRKATWYRLTGSQNSGGLARASANA